MMIVVKAKRGHFPKLYEVRFYEPILLIAMAVLTGAIAISAHALIIQYLNPPVINIDPTLNQIVGFIIRFVTVTSAVIIYLRV